MYMNACIHVCIHACLIVCMHVYMYCMYVCMHACFYVYAGMYVFIHLLTHARTCVCVCVRHTHTRSSFNRLGVSRSVRCITVKVQKCVYCSRAGDTLASIAAQYDTDWLHLYTTNPLITNPDSLPVGSRINTVRRHLKHTHARTRTRAHTHTR